MKGAFKLFTIKGTTVGIHWTFLLLVSWVLLIQAATGESMQQTLWTLFALIAVFVCVLLHELGHSFSALHFGIPTRSILLLPIGGIATIEHQPAKPVQEVMVSLAGPLVNLFIALITLPFLHPYIPFWKATTVIYNIEKDNFLYFLHTINIMLALFNLIPAYPLDGGKALRGLLNMRTTSGRATNIAVLASRIIAAVFIITGFISFNLLLAFFGIFLIIAGTAEKQRSIMKTSLRDIPLSSMVMHDYFTLDAGMPVNEAAASLENHHQNYFVITDKDKPIGIADRDAIISTLTTDMDNRTVRTLIKRGIKILNGEKTASAIWDELPSEPTVIVPVAVKGKLAGVVSRDSIIEYLLIHHEKITDSPVGKAVNAIYMQFNKMLLLFPLLCFTACNQPDTSTAISLPADTTGYQVAERTDTIGYYRKMIHLLHNKPSVKWPLENTPPLPGAILPYKRIVAYYGNLYSAQMGILGELPPPVMKEKLLQEVKKWEQADTLFPVQPALHYIAITAQGKSGKDHKYRLRMPFNQIDPCHRIP